MKIKRLKIPLYFGDLIIIQEKSLKNIPGKYKPENFDFRNYDAFTHEIIEKGYKTYILVFKKPTKSKIIAHEALHIVSRVFNDRNIDYSHINDEHAAYFIGWIVGECHKILKINDIKK